MNEPVHNICICGTLKSGKTTLAKKLCEAYFRRIEMRSMVLCVNSDEVAAWEKLPFVFDVYHGGQEHLFWPRVWKEWGRVIVVEEATQTIARDKKIRPAFTRMRHLEHRFITIAHHGTELDPTMRNQTEELFLFRQPEGVCEMWSEAMCERGLLKASTLNQYEYLHLVKWGKCSREIVEP